MQPNDIFNDWFEAWILRLGFIYCLHMCKTDSAQLEAPHVSCAFLLKLIRISKVGILAK